MLPLPLPWHHAKDWAAACEQQSEQPGRKATLRPWRAQQQSCSSQAPRAHGRRVPGAGKGRPKEPHEACPALGTPHAASPPLKELNTRNATLQQQQPPSTRGASPNHCTDIPAAGPPATATLWQLRQLIRRRRKHECFKESNAGDRRRRSLAAAAARRLRKAPKSGAGLCVCTCAVDGKTTQPRPHSVLFGTRSPAARGRSQHLANPRRLGGLPIPCAPPALAASSSVPGGSAPPWPVPPPASVGQLVEFSRAGERALSLCCKVNKGEAY